MTRYEHLPIYKQAMAIAVHFIINGFGCYVVKQIDIIDNIMQCKVDFAVISLQEESLIYSHKPR
jgi:hypothetical protein